MENKLMIITDSCSDIRGEDKLKYNIEVVPMTVTFGEESYLEGETISIEEFYEKLVSSKEFPKTSQPSPESYERLILKAKDNGQDVLIITISTGLSGTYQSACLAASLAEYEDHVYVLDSLNCLTGERLLVKEAAKLRDEGKTIEQIKEVLEDIKHRIRYFSICDTLEYFCKGGRLSRAKMILGSIVGIKPFIDLDANGKIRQFGQGIGINRSLRSAVNFVTENERDPNFGVCYGYTGTKDNALRLIEKTKGILNVDEIDLTQIGAASGAHIGPGGSCVVYVSKEPRK